MFVTFTGRVSKRVNCVRKHLLGESPLVELDKGIFMKTNGVPSFPNAPLLNRAFLVVHHPPTYKLVS